jgi:hypothetical protein
MSRSATDRSLGFTTAATVLALLLFSPPALASTASTDGVVAPAGAPVPRGYAGMADDPMHGQVVLFGGINDDGTFADTWTWDGSAWTKRNPGHSPWKRDAFGMVWDAATGTVVLFGGAHLTSGDRNDTWTWDGTDWTKQTPAHSPPRRHGVSMAYDAARGDVVLFGGCCKRSGEYRRDTWTWDGTDWTKQTPAHSPTRRSWAAMSDDEARGQVVLFGGRVAGDGRGNTWTWDGADWTKRSPAHSPSLRFNSRMAYDAAAGQVVLFGGFNDHSFELGDTWTWDGTDWTKQTPAHSPTERDGHGLAYDPARDRVVLFGGTSFGYVGDTWTWDGSDWTQAPNGSIQLSPRSGPPGGNLVVSGSGFAAGELVSLTFVDSAHGSTLVEKVGTDSVGGFEVNFKIPADATRGSQRVKATGLDSGSIARRGFTVT